MEFLKDLVELLKTLLEDTALPDWLKSLVVIAVIVLVMVSLFQKVVTPVVKMLKGLYENVTRRLFIKRNMYPYFTELTPREVYEAIQYYIPTRYSRLGLDPANEEEPTPENFTKEQEREGYPLLLNRFLETEFDSSKNNRFYFVLADCGMGKTTFLMNLFYYTLLRKKRHPCKYINMVNPGVIDAVKKIKEESGAATAETILLLDALDENDAATRNYAEFMRELEKEAREFYCVVITSRTNFFEKATEERLPGVKRGERVTQDKIAKFYVTPFTDNDIQKYLKRRYPYPWNKKRRDIAWDMMKDNKNLAARPMLLKFMDDLLNDSFKKQEKIKGDNILTPKDRNGLLMFALMILCLFTTGFIFDWPFLLLFSTIILSFMILAAFAAFTVICADLLSHLNSIVDYNFRLHYNFQLYKILFDLWIARECDKTGQNPNVLFQECLIIAKAIYNQWTKTGQIGISSQELHELNINTPGIQNIKLKGHALINRTSMGVYKFAHQSYWEYLLAYCAFYSSESASEINIHYFDRGNEFFLEMVSKFDPYYAALFLNVIGECRFFPNDDKVVFLLPSNMKDTLTVDKIAEISNARGEASTISTNLYNMLNHSCIVPYLYRGAIPLEQTDSEDTFKRILAGIAKYHMNMANYEDERIKSWYEILDSRAFNRRKFIFDFNFIVKAVIDYIEANHEFLKGKGGDTMG